ncbi:MAG: hypothetical protein IT385_16075 [Deltaproteobacteria bacterium]|nr:hypothetical protein [Deltaproteobacteria bacterium]
MATAVLFIGWDRPATTHPQDAWKHLTEKALPALDGFQREGHFESKELVALTAHGGDLNGFILLFGERDKLDALRRTDAFEAFSMDMSAHFHRYGVVPGLNGAGIAKVMERMRARG